ncbi:hypothetical protein ASE94_06110 [Devosia sp. Leaf64]|nr:hypothetical protein ASE94_06110 [Devosia sp. Leaf64]
MESAMTHTDLSPLPEHADDRRFIASLAPRLPRMAAVTAVVVFGTFAAIQFIPQTFEARLAVGLPAGSSMDEAASQLLDQQHLAEVVSRLSPDIIAEMRRNGGGITDTTTLLRQRLILTPDAKTAALKLAALAGTPARARAIVEATAASYMAKAELPPALAPEPKIAEAAEAVKPAPGAENTVETLQQRLSLAWEDRVKLESRARRIEGLIAEGNYTMLAMDAENLPGLGRQLDDLAQLETERDKLAITYLPNHPTMRTLAEEIDSLNSEISKGVQQLAALVTADRDAARRLEDGLRDQLAAAANVPAIDTSVTTGSITGPTEPQVTALPRPVRTDLALGLAGGLAFFGQIGLFALFRPRPLVEEQFEDLEFIEPLAEDAPTEDLVEEAEEAEPVEQIPPAAPLHNWLTAVPVAAIPVSANWLGEAEAEKPSQPEPIRPAAKAAPQRQEQPIDGAEVIALTGRAGEASIAARRLLSKLDDEGKRVCVVDASSRRRGRVPGISDLSLGLASFADIVHGSGADEAALVPWGRQHDLDARARPVRILIQALAELYDVVIITLDADDTKVASALAAMADTSLDAEAVLPKRRRAA